MTSQADDTSERIERVAAALRSHNIETIVVDTGDEARKVVFGMIPVENAQVRERMGVDTVLEKVLLMYGEWQPGRTTVVLVREPVGV
jgi:hypothetical protein